MKKIAHVGRCDEAERMNKKPGHHVRPSKIVYHEIPCTGPRLEGPYCSVGEGHPRDRERASATRSRLWYCKK